MNKIFLSFFASLNLLLVNSYANEIDDMSIEELMNIKVYSATKSYKRIEDIPSTIFVITRKEIDKYGYRNLGEILNNVPGLFVIDNTYDFQIASRGSYGSSFKLMLNNNPITPIRTPQSVESNKNYFLIPAEFIDKIEIVKSSQGVTYGNNSMYGSINVITNDFNEKNIVSTSMGNKGQKKAVIRINKSNENGGFTINSVFNKFDNLEGVLEQSDFRPSYYATRPSNAANNLEEVLKENSLNSVDLSYRYRNLTADFYYSKLKYGFFLDPTIKGSKADQREKLFSLTYEDDLNSKLSYKLNITHTQKDLNRNIDSFVFIQGFNIYYPYTNETISNIKRDEADLHLNYELNDKIKFLVGTNLSRVSRKYNSVILNSNKNYQFNTQNIYTKIQYDLNSKLSIFGGYRFSKVDNFDILTLDNQGMKEEKINEKKINTPEFSLLYHFNSYNHLKFLYGEASQLKINKSDEHEDIKSYELSYITYKNKFNFTGSIFYNYTKNIYPYVLLDNAISKTTNTDISSKGIELELVYKPSYSFQLSSSLTYQESDAKNGIEVPYSPKFMGKLSALYQNEFTKYNLHLNYIDSMSATTNENGELLGIDSPKNITLNGNILHNISKNSQLNLHITNILNKENKIPAGDNVSNIYGRFVTPQREILLSYIYKF